MARNKGSHYGVFLSWMLRRYDFRSLRLNLLRSYQVRSALLLAIAGGCIAAIAVMCLLAAISPKVIVELRSDPHKAVWRIEYATEPADKGVIITPGDIGGSSTTGGRW